MALVSVVITAHRGDRFLPHALPSVRAQTHTDWEALVVHDRPSTVAAAVVRAFADTAPDRRVEYLETKAVGPAAARNLGISAARGDYIAFLDEDDLWMPDHLAAALDALLASQAELAFSTVEMFDDASGEPRGVWGPTAEERERFPVGLYLRNYIAVLSVVMTRTVVDRHGRFDAARRFWYGEDHDYWVRLAFAGVRFVEVPGVHGRYRKGHPSGTANARALAEVHCRVYRRHLAGALRRSGEPRGVRDAVAARHIELARAFAADRSARALQHALWALWISPARRRLLRSAARHGWRPL